ncbi:hypothetical protein BO78DRAFT_394294 [Aspergillus sclerotiicarbonarius CBS 121057]|uniref:Uncharacterized protein n=1 Tax=Aspergillus sclerotiicarbonarius (strain CBS 121057 / IBT 28362) TaxID=1448318 RepID=A0A319ER66_ASPSB|nr:hypothetical protein BO78DRAFT_394294 [Aspergillus sclerotiicarbonarius CBS 121057]
MVSFASAEVSAAPHYPSNIDYIWLLLRLYMYASTFKAQLNCPKKPGWAKRRKQSNSPDGMRDMAHGAKELQPNLYPGYPWYMEMQSDEEQTGNRKQS